MFKSYTSNDNLLLPPCLGDFIPRNDPVRVVHRIIEQINLEELYRKYSPKGCSAYHPLFFKHRGLLFADNKAALDAAKAERESHYLVKYL